MGMFNSKVKLRARIQKNNNFASSVKYRMDIYVQVFISHNGSFTTLQVKSNNEMEVNVYILILVFPRYNVKKAKVFINIFKFDNLIHNSKYTNPNRNYISVALCLTLLYVQTQPPGCDM